MLTPTLSSFSSSGSAPTSANASGVGSTNKAPTGNVNDLFAQLKDFTWKGVSFPVTETELEIRKDLVIHKYADRDGAYVENTGRHPVQVTARIPFLNYLYPRGSESWAAGTLYPFTWRAFIEVSLENTSGRLQHPELDWGINCKIDLARTTWSGTVRGGVWVHATWVESDDEAVDQLANEISFDSPVGQIQQSAISLDEQIATLAAAVSFQQNPLPDLPYSFTALSTFITGAIDTVTVLEMQQQGQTNAAIHQAQLVEDAVVRAENASPLYWPIFQNCQRQKDAALALQAQPAITQNGRVLKSLVTQKDATLGQLAAQTGSDVATFIVLNAEFVGSPVVPKGSTVQYFAKAA